VSKLLAIRKIIISFILAIVVFLAALPVRADGPVQYSGFTQPDPETEYYRGVYDVCFWSMAKSGMSKTEAVSACLYIAKWAEKSEWYEQPSEGWKGLEQVPAGWGA